MARCPGSGRMVSQARRKHAVYTTQWMTFCPWHAGAAPFALAEPHPAGGYRRRYVEHSN